MELTLQPFDSSIFGGPVFRLTIPAQMPDAGLLPSLQVTLAGAVRQNARLVMARVPSLERNTIEVLRQAGFIQVETLVTLEAPAASPAVFPPRVRLAGAESARSCAAIAREAFIHDRLHADRRIDPDVAAAIKEAWVLNGFAGRADACFVADSSDGETAGFLLALKRQDALVIDLVAVAPHHQGLGLGRDLLAAAKVHAGAFGATTVRVGTQAANTASLRLYAAAGFTPVAEAATLHYIPEAGQYRPLVRT